MPSVPRCCRTFNARRWWTLILAFCNFGSLAGNSACPTTIFTSPSARALDDAVGRFQVAVPAGFTSSRLFASNAGRLPSSRTAKPSYIKLQTSWISDRTLCYLASGKPVVVQHTGPSSFLPNGEGMFRFSTAQQASEAFDAINADYERHCRAARKLAETYFDAKQVVAKILSHALMDASRTAKRLNRRDCRPGQRGMHFPS